MGLYQTVFLTTLKELNYRMRFEDFEYLSAVFWAGSLGIIISTRNLWGSRSQKENHNAWGTSHFILDQIPYRNLVCVCVGYVSACVSVCERVCVFVCVWVNFCVCVCVCVCVSVCVCEWGVCEWGVCECMCLCGLVCVGVIVFMCVCA